MDYADIGTPDVEFEYDLLGRKKRLKQGPTGTQDITEFAYTDFGGSAGVKYTAGTLSGISLTNRYDAHLRRYQMQVVKSGSVIYATGYGYDTGSRVGWVTNGYSVVSYGYHANSPLMNTVTYQHSGTTRLTQTKEYDALNRQTYIGNEAGAGGTESWGYEYNDANQRSVVHLAVGSYWEYRYDRLGQVTAGRKFFKDGRHHGVLLGHPQTGTSPPPELRRAGSGQANPLCLDRNLLHPRAAPQRARLPIT